MPRQCRYCRPKSAPSETLCAYLVQKFPYFTLHQWKEQVEAGYLFVNEELVKDSERILQQQDVISFAPPPSKEPEVDTTHVDLLYEDDSVLVCCKNGNIPVAEGGRYCEHTLLRYFQQQLSQREEGVAAGGRPLFTSRGPLSFSSSSFHLPFHHPNYFPFLCAWQSSSSPLLSLPSHFVSSTTADETLEEAKKREVMVCSNAYSKSPTVQATFHAEAPEVQKAAGRKRSHSEKGESSLSLARHSPSLFPVHRLDKETSGVLLFGKSMAIAQRLTAMLEDHSRRVTAEVEERTSHVQQTEIENPPPPAETNTGRHHLERADDDENDAPDGSSSCHSPRRSSSTAPSLDPLSLSPSSFEALRVSTGQKIEKSYLAVLAGVAKEGEIHVVRTRIGSMAKDAEWKDHEAHQQLAKLKMLCYSGRRRNALSGNAEDTKTHAPVQGKVAVSRIMILSVHEVYKFSVARIDILTGRTHQIRLHCAHIGYPIVGDKLYYTRTPGVYGGALPVEDAVYLSRVRATDSDVSSSDGFLTDILAPSFRCRRHLLHSTKLMFAHPQAVGSSPGEMASSCSTSRTVHPSSQFSSRQEENKGFATEEGVIHEENETIQHYHRHYRSRMEQSPTYFTFVSDPSFWFLSDVRCDDLKAKEALECSVYKAFTNFFFM